MQQLVWLRDFNDRQGDQVPNFLAGREKSHLNYLSHITRKPVFEVFDQVSLKPVCSATEAG